jgi:hypothetical protein
MKTWTFHDKSQWPERGPWDNEPDKAQWQDEATGLACLMLRARSHWCGYVGVPETHPAFEKDYSTVGADVHGGLTFADFCQESHDGNIERLVCHVPEPGQPARVWWLGFDCIHSGDARPAMTQVEYEIERRFPTDGHYRTFDYVKTETARLAQQLAEMK